MGFKILALINLTEQIALRVVKNFVLMFFSIVLFLKNKTIPLPYEMKVIFPYMSTISRFTTSKMLTMLFVAFVVFTHPPLFAQTKVNVSIGAGWVEQYHLGFNLEMKQWQVGLILGGNERIGYSRRTAGWSLAYHFWGRHSKYTQKNWYLSTGMNYLNRQIDYFEYHHFFVNSRLGRTFHLSPKLGLAVEAGRLFDIHSRYLFDSENYPDDWFMCGNDSRFSTAYSKVNLNAKLIFRL